MFDIIFIFLILVYYLIHYLLNNKHYQNITLIQDIVNKFYYI